jgi:ribosome-associated translation inhibitor RaiA
MYAAVDVSEEVLIRQAEKFKSKHQGRLLRMRRLLSPRNYLHWGRKIIRR